jgi:UDP-N-acetylglucosamine--dolichyl-phosphate N-acetylglucosaminephosphotransferase
MDIFILVSVFSGVIAFIITMILTHRIIPILKKQEIVNHDLNKMDRPLIPEMGGISVIFAFFFTMTLSLYWNTTVDNKVLAMILFTIMGISLVGIIDDLLDIHQLTKSIMPFLIAIPLGIGFPDRTLTLPFTGGVDVGLWMVLLIPFGITIITNLTNILEGFNGLGVGLGIIITTTLIIISFLTDETDGLILFIPLLGVLIGFFYFNKYPSKIFPGDTLMFFQAAVIGCAAIIGNLKTIAAILYLPLFVEFILKARGRFPAKNHGDIQEDGTLSYSGKTFSLSHLLMKRLKVTEKKLVYILWTMEAIMCTVMIIVVYLLGPEYAW